jgi:hypothetical protein
MNEKEPMQLHCKKVNGFPVPSQDVTYQTLSFFTVFASRFSPFPY